MALVEPDPGELPGPGTKVILLSLERVLAAVPMALVLIMALVRVIEQSQIPDEIIVGAVIPSFLSIVFISYLRRLGD